MNKCYVYDLSTKRIKRYGFVQFENENIFNAGTEGYVCREEILSPSIQYQSWYWNTATLGFQTTAP